MVKVGVVGLGKMGISHFSIVNSHPRGGGQRLRHLEDVLDVLGRYTGVPTWRDFDEMLDKAGLDAVIIATPSGLHGPMVRKALERGLHVFCEKPFCLDWREAEALAAARGREGPDQPGRLPLPLRRRLPGDEAPGRRRRHRRGHPRPRRGLRAGGAEAEGLDLAHQPRRGRRLPLRLRRPPDQPGQLVLRPAGAGQRARCSAAIFSADTDDEVYSTFAYRVRA